MDAPPEPDSGKRNHNGENPRRRTRRRLHLNCEPCRVRKIRCTRELPACDACVRRGIAHKCRYEDERDQVAKRSTQGPSFMSSVAALTKEPDGTLSSETQYWISVLPSRSEFKNLLYFYMQEVEPMFSFMNRELAIDQCEYFWEHCESVRTDVLHGRYADEGCSPAIRAFWGDPFFSGLAAMAFMIVQSCFDNMAADQRANYNITEDRHYWNGAIYFLNRADAYERPTLWALQTMLLLRFHNMRNLMLRKSVLWHSVCVRLAQSMGLNRLGSTLDDLRQPNTAGATQEPAPFFNSTLHHWRRNNMSSNNGVVDDSPILFAATRLSNNHMWSLDFAPGNLALREIARRIWQNLVAFEWIMCSYTDNCYMVSENMSLTSPPANLDDIEVLSLDRNKLQDRQGLEARLSNTGATDSSFVIAVGTIANAMRVQVDLENQRHLLTGASRLELSDVQHVEQKLLQVLSGMPEFFRLDGQSEHLPTVIQTHQTRPYLWSQRLMLNLFAHSRLMRLHFPFLLQGATDATYMPSSITCVRCALVSIYIASSLVRHGGAWARLFFLFNNVLFCAVVMHLASCTARDPIHRSTPGTNAAAFGIWKLDVLFQDICKALAILRTIAPLTKVESRVWSAVTALETVYSSNDLSSPSYSDAPVTISAGFSGSPDTIGAHTLGSNGLALPVGSPHGLPEPSSGLEDPLGWLQQLEHDQILDLGGLDELVFGRDEAPDLR